MKKLIFWAILIAVVILMLVFFFKDTLPFVLGAVAAIVIKWAYDRFIK